MPRASHPQVTARRAVGALLLTATLALAGCGGGVYVGIDGSSDSPPAVTLNVSRSQAYAGDRIALDADARDDYAIKYVEFWYDDGSGRATQLMVRDYSWPYAVDTVMPATPYGGVSYSAIAVDDAGHATYTSWKTVYRL
ncbi:hypothetical protein [Leptothrix discophora]|uniref:Lipoprotein n=1 Tax=Leptothrix discophora TaxID=89 RepID=A0ABT9FZX0_LEPDI|nr:hypothetical protein [Leptothrix discophora]MDP4299776.1 hypothetical protein [Leptothrix discophora]